MTVPIIKHIKEWLNSAVNQNIIDLNVVSLFNLEAYDRLLYAIPASDRRNDGRIRDKLLRRYAHTEFGGWWCSGVDILTGKEAYWGQFKPDVPYRYRKNHEKGFGPKKEESIKYEPPINVSTEIFALKIPLTIWKAIATRYNIELPKNIIVTPDGRALGFWNWVIENPIPLIITEGAKKAGCLVSANFVAIALPGIYNGYRRSKDEFGNKIGLPYLIPQLQAFVRTKREIVFCFDNDVKPKTVKNVRRAIEMTGRLFAKEGCKVSAISWSYPEKGVDDLIAARGNECFERLYEARLPLSRFNLNGLLDLSKYNPEIINQQYLSETLETSGEAQLIGLRSPKGSNKTGWIVLQVQKAIARGIPVLVITHRIQLAKALCGRFGIDHIEEVRHSVTKGILGYGLCIDSLHPDSQAQFDPDDWSEAIVIIDECEQVIWHMLDSNTCMNNRVAIIENFQLLLKTVISTKGKIYLSDADLSCIVIDYVRRLVDKDVNIWVVENVYAKKKKRKLFVYTGGDPRQLVAALVEAISRGERHLVQVSAQKAKYKWGSTNLESYLKQRFPCLKILRIDAESITDPNHPAYGCITNLDSILSNYDLAIASPVIETGISIELKDYFDSVWCIASGVQTVDAVGQALERLRDDVPRHIWIKTTAKGHRIGNGATSVKKMLASTHKITSANIRLLQQAGIDDLDELDVNFSPESLITWAKMACIVNVGKNNYRDLIVDKLLRTGYELAQTKDEETDCVKAIKQQICATAKNNYHQYCRAVSRINTPTSSELELLNQKKVKTVEERYRERKGNLQRRYGIEVTPQLVEKDDEGWYPQLQLHYYLTIGKAYLNQKEKRSLSPILEQGNGRGFKPDLNKKQLSVRLKALELIDIAQFFDCEAEFTKESLTDWLELIIELRFDLKAILGISINPERDSPIAVAQRFLKKLGLRLEFKFWRGSRSAKQRVYSGCNLAIDWRSQIFNYWLSKEVV